MGGGTNHRGSSFASQAESILELALSPDINGSPTKFSLYVLKSSSGGKGHAKHFGKMLTKMMKQLEQTGSFSAR